MTGSAPAAAEGTTSMTDLFTLQIPLHRMSAIKTEHLIIACQKIQADRSGLLDNHRLLPQILYDGAPCNDIRLLQHAVQKRHSHMTCPVFQINFQRLRFPCICIDCRKSRQSILFLFHLVSDIAQITAIRAIRIAHDQGAVSKIPNTHTRIFLRQRIQRIGPVASHIRRVT